MTNDAKQIDGRSPFDNKIMQKLDTKSRRGKKWPVSVAPMMEWSDRHFRYFMRLITRESLLYTPMVTSGAVIHGERERIIGFSEAEKPLALQLGGDDPAEMAECARIAEDWGYHEVNINVGCPSERVQKGNFGACLMATPDVVAECVAKMRAAVRIPVTVKHRIGIDDLQSYEEMANFVNVVRRSGCDRFIVHARIAWLKGLNPKENRTVPPLRYDDIYRLKEAFPGLTIEINGGIKTIEEISQHLEKTDGVMIGRAAYENPFLFATVDQLFYGSRRPPVTRREIIEAMIAYIEAWREKGTFPNRIIRHMHGLFAFQRGARAWKRYLSENAHKPETTGKILLNAIQAIPDEVLNELPNIDDLSPKAPVLQANFSE